MLSSLLNGNDLKLADRQIALDETSPCLLRIRYMFARLMVSRFSCPMRFEIVAFESHASSRTNCSIKAKRNSLELLVHSTRSYLLVNDDIQYGMFEHSPGAVFILRV